eukprot:COSAG06_NODE_16556_length_994_cov_1.148603_2_plen_210_part_01
MVATGPLRRQEATYLDGTWGWGKEDPETGEDLYNISSVVRTPMAFEEEAWDKPQHRYTWEQVRAMERAELDYWLDLHSIYGQPWSWFNVDYIWQEHLGAQDPVWVLLEDTQTNDDAVGEEGYKERHILRGSNWTQPSHRHQHCTSCISTAYLVCIPHHHAGSASLIITPGSIDHELAEDVLAKHRVLLTVAREYEAAVLVTVRTVVQPVE